MDNKISLQNTFNSLLQDPQLTLEILLKTDSFLLFLKNSPNQLNLINFLCKDENPIKILKYALLHSTVMEDFKTIHSCSMSILTSSYFNDHSLKKSFLENLNFREQLVNFPKSEFINDKIICANYSKIIETFICYLYKFPNEKKIIQGEFEYLPNFIINNIEILSFRELLIKLIISFPELIHRNEDLFINMIQFNSSSTYKLFFALQSIFRILKEKPSLYSLMENEKFGNQILKVGMDNYDSSPLISTQAFEIFFNIKEKSYKSDFFDIIKNIEFKFTTLNSATANGLRLFPNNLENFIIPFFEFKCTTFLNDKMVSIFRSLKRQKMCEIIAKYHINNLIMLSFPIYISSKTNGHYLELSKIICDSKIICCTEHETEWNLFVLQRLDPRRSQANKKTEVKISTEKKFIHSSVFKQIVKSWK